MSIELKKMANLKKGDKFSITEPDKPTYRVEGINSKSIKSKRLNCRIFDNNLLKDVRDIDVFHHTD
jgi:hypothetical protein